MTRCATATTPGQLLTEPRTLYKRRAMMATIVSQNLYSVFESMYAVLHPNNERDAERDIPR